MSVIVIDTEPTSTPGSREVHHLGRTDGRLAALSRAEARQRALQRALRDLARKHWIGAAPAATSRS